MTVLSFARIGLDTFAIQSIAVKSFVGAVVLISLL